tara:strand:+ start:1277 stop:2110 length:834 start_codon:yes stop_codon:yes gene_type:complete
MNLIMDIGYNKGEFAKKCFEEYPDCKVIGVEANPIFKGGVWTEVLVTTKDPPGLIGEGHLTMVTDKIPSLPAFATPGKLMKKSNNPLQLASGQCEVLNYVMAAPDAAATVPFHISLWSSTISSASPRFIRESRFAPSRERQTSNWHEIRQVPTITMDKLIEIYGTPDLIKIDVEGYEYEVLKGLSRKQKKICFEWGEEEADLLVSSLFRLSQLGYEEFGIIGHFEEGPVFDKITYFERGDEYLKEPENYFPLPNILSEVERCTQPSRKINWGMAWCR